MTMMMNKRQAAMLAAQMRHPAGKAIPPSAEVQNWQWKVASGSAGRSSSLPD